jgi:hypothetical protein
LSWFGERRGYNFLFSPKSPAILDATDETAYLIFALANHLFFGLAFVARGRILYNIGDLRRALASANPGKNNRKYSTNKPP